VDSQQLSVSAALFWRALHGVTRFTPLLLASLVGLGSSAPAQPRPQRDAAYDNLIVPGVRIGPVSLGAPVREIVGRLGTPNSTRRIWEPGRVRSIYGRPRCIEFYWQDSGLDPREDGGQIDATCNTWQTSNGLHVGSSVAEVIAAMGNPDAVFGPCNGNGVCVLCYRPGITFSARNRVGPIVTIAVNRPLQRGDCVGAFQG
jgi:hypothetical protein